MSDPIIASVCTISGGEYREVTACVRLTDGTTRETTDRVDMALVLEVLRYQCARTYALRHLEGWCECVHPDDCARRVRELLRETERPREPIPQTPEEWAAHYARRSPPSPKETP